MRKTRDTFASSWSCLTHLCTDMSKITDTDLIDFYEINECFHGVNSRGEHFVHIDGGSFKGKTFREAVIAAMKDMHEERKH